MLKIGAHVFIMLYRSVAYYFVYRVLTGILRVGDMFWWICFSAEILLP